MAALLLSLLHAGKALDGPVLDGGSWENELKLGLLGTFQLGFSLWDEEEFLSPAWTTQRSLASSGNFSPTARRGQRGLEAIRI